ncbi:MAG: aminotransferase class IV [Clostridiales bacterium]|nr:aminotransferase class IV [Clostridiales bacterium]
MSEIEKSLAFNYGIGAFETMKIESGEITDLDLHMERLKHALEVIRLKQFSIEDIENEIQHKLVKNKLKDGIIKVVVNDMGINAFFRENIYKCENYKEGFTIALSEIPVLEKNIYRIKSTNYMIYYLEWLKAKESGFDEIIFFNTENSLSEGSKTNVFIVKDDTILTPDLKSGCLDGIMRKRILTDQKFPVIESRISLDELLSADAVFLTNAIMGVMPVKEIKGRKFDSVNHLWVKELIRIYSKRGNENG